MSARAGSRDTHTCLGCGDRFTRWQTPGVGMYIGYYCQTCVDEREANR